MDVLLWIVRIIIISLGIFLVIWILQGKKQGKFNERYPSSFIAIGITVLVLGAILLLVSFSTELASFYGWYLIILGSMALLVGFVIRRFYSGR